MNLVALKSVEFSWDVRGPGDRRSGVVTRTFATHKVKSGTTELSPTGLTILWDRAAHAVYLVLPEDKSDPCVVVSWHNVMRALPVDFDFIAEPLTAPKRH